MVRDLTKQYIKICSVSSLVQCLLVFRLQLNGTIRDGEIVTYGEPETPCDTVILDFSSNPQSQLTIRCCKDSIWIHSKTIVLQTVVLWKNQVSSEMLRGKFLRAKIHVEFFRKPL